jgi:hypothetical protein
MKHTGNHLLLEVRLQGRAFETKRGEPAGDRPTPPPASFRGLQRMFAEQMQVFEAISEDLCRHAESRIIGLVHAKIQHKHQIFATKLASPPILRILS